MGVYSGHILVENAIPEREITLEEVLEIQESALSIMSELCLNEEDEEDDGEFEELMEGANLDYSKAFKDGKKKYSESIRAAKKALKAKDYKKAKSEIKEAQKALDGIEKTLKEVDSTVGSAVLGWLAAALLTMIEMIIPLGYITIGKNIAIKGASDLSSMSLTSLIAGTKEVQKAASATGFGLGMYLGGIVTGIIQGVILSIRDIKQFIADNKDPDLSKPQVLNYYRNKLCSYIKNMRKHLDKLSVAIERKEKAEK